MADDHVSRTLALLALRRRAERDRDGRMLPPLDLESLPRAVLELVDEILVENLEQDQ